MRVFVSTVSEIKVDMCSIEVKNTLFRSFCTPICILASYGGIFLYKVCIN